jgi:hypothetical protein
MPEGAADSYPDIPTDRPREAVHPDDHPLLATLDRYWWSIKPAGALPGRQHFDPLDLPRLLPWIYLMDVVDAPGGRRRYRFRLIGTGLVEKFQRDSTGRFVDDLYAPNHLRTMEAGFDAVIAAGRPLAAERCMPVEGREYLRFRRLVCPLARDGQTVDMLVGVHAYG